MTVFEKAKPGLNSILSLNIENVDDCVDFFINNIRCDSCGFFDLCCELNPVPEKFEDWLATLKDDEDDIVFKVSCADVIRIGLNKELEDQ